MKLKDYMKKLEKIATENPEALEMTVITSSDDEGNCFKRVFYSPSVGNFQDGMFEADLKEVNAVCLN